MPSRLRCRMLSHSSSESAPKTVSMKRPSGVVVLMFSFRLMNSAPLSVRLETMGRRSRTFLAIREILSTVTESQARTNAIIAL